jgi:hypothetical protein
MDRVATEMIRLYRDVAAARSRSVPVIPSVA